MLKRNCHILGAMVGCRLLNRLFATMVLLCFLHVWGQVFDEKYSVQFPWGRETQCTGLLGLNIMETTKLEVILINPQNTHLLTGGLVTAGRG